MKIKCVRVVAISMALMLSLSTVGISTFAAEDPVSGVSAVSASELPLQTAEAGVYCITGFENIANNKIEIAEKLEVGSLGLPINLFAFIYNSETPVAVPVTWRCAEDYENTQLNTYTFTPMWDETKFTLAKEADLSAVPHIELIISGNNAEAPVPQPVAQVAPDPIARPTEQDFEFAKGTITGFKASYLSSLTLEQAKNIELVIPQAINGTPVTAIADHAFNGKGLIGSLIIPDSVTKIGRYSFPNCAGLTGTLTLSKNLTEIAEYAFAYSGFTGELIIPSGVTIIGKSAFRQSEAYDGFAGTLVLPESVTSIGNSAFSGQKAITTIQFTGNNLSTIGSWTFQKTGLSGVLSIPASVKNIGNNAFEETLLNTVYLPKRTSADIAGYIGANTFANCKSLTAIICDKDNYNAIRNILYGTAKEKLGYLITVNFDDGRGGAYTSLERLYAQAYDFQKNGDVWAVNKEYRLPTVQNVGTDKYVWALSRDSIQEVSPTDKVTQETLYAVRAYENPVIAYGAGIDKVYDGIPQALTVTATHPLAKKASEAQINDVVFYYTWRWGTIGTSPIVQKGYDKNSYDVLDVRMPDYAIGCSVTVQACRMTTATKASVFYTETHDFSVWLRQAEPKVTPVYPKGMIPVADGLPNITLSDADTEGSIAWDAGQTLENGKKNYKWTFSPIKNAEGAYNFKKVTGTAELYGVSGKVFTIEALANENGTIEPSGPFEVVQGTNQLFEFQPNPGCHIETVLVDGADVTNQLTRNTYQIENLQSSHTVQVTFALTDVDDMEEIISQLPDIQGGEPTTEQKNEVLDVQIQYADLADEIKEKITPEVKEQLYTALAGLPQIELVVEGAGASVSNVNALLANMQGADAKKLQDSDTSTLTFTVASDVADQNSMEMELIQSMLNGAQLYDSYDVNASMTLKTEDGERTTELSELDEPIALNFTLSQELISDKNSEHGEVYMIRSHSDANSISTSVLHNLSTDEKVFSTRVDKFSVFALALKKADYTITASAGANGSISPQGDIVIASGENQKFTFVPNEGFKVETVLVDGVSVGNSIFYTFENVTAPHSITVHFVSTASADSDTSSSENNTPPPNNNAPPQSTASAPPVVTHHKKAVSSQSEAVSSESMADGYSTEKSAQTDDSVSSAKDATSKAPETESPKDSTPIWIYGGLLIVALAIVAALMTLIQRRGSPK